MRALLLIPALLPLSFAGANAQEKPDDGAAAEDLFTRADVFELEMAMDPQISPDGSEVAYVRARMDIMTDRPNRDVWIVPVSGGDNRPLLSGAESFSSPRWSPSGDRLAYVSSAGSRGAEIWVRWNDSGQTALLTNLPESPSSLAWSPDGSQIAFTMFVPKDRKPLAAPPKKPEGAEWAPPPKVIETTSYRADGAGYLDEGFTHVFVVPADGGTPRRLTNGDFNHGGAIAWSADGEKIYLSANRAEGWELEPVESDIWSVAVDGGEMTKLTSRDGPDTAPAVSPDGTRIAYIGFDDKKLSTQTAKLYVMNADGSNRRALAKDFDRSINGVAWVGNDTLMVQYDDSGRTYLGRIPADGGEVRPLVRDLGGNSFGRPYTSGSWSVAGNGAYAYTTGRTTRLADVAAAPADGEPLRLTRLNDDIEAQRTFGQTERITWKSSHDEREIEGWVLKPPHFDSSKNYPFILEIHGGPHAAYGPHFSVEGQLYAAAGYVVLFANPRGSTSYGQEFAELIDKNYPSEDYDDLMSGVDAVIAEGYVDEENLFVTGGSGGGVLSAWIVGKTDRFDAAVVAKPVINWISFSLTADAYTYFAPYWFGAMPWEDPDAYWERSPLSLVGNVSTPTMLLTGEADYRTPISESEQFYQALKLRGVESAMVRIPEASHGITARPSHLIAKVDHILAWFERYRTDGEEQSDDEKPAESAEGEEG